MLLIIKTQKIGFRTTLKEIKVFSFPKLAGLSGGLGMKKFSMIMLNRCGTLLNQIHTLDNIIFKDVTQSLQQPSPMQVCWIAPPGDVMKLNTDGSAFGNPGQAGFAGITMNSLGNCGTQVSWDPVALQLQFMQSYSPSIMV
ncbi:hypothetical protein HKD37_03G008152 [Glycine soja]